MSLKFNLLFGQMRPAPQGLAVGLNLMGTPSSPPGKDDLSADGKMYHRRKRPIKSLQLRSLDGSRAAVLYTTDALGNITVDAPGHQNTLMQMGWPLYQGPGTGPVTLDQLLFPRPHLGTSDPYYRVILSELEARRG